MFLHLGGNVNRLKGPNDDWNLNQSGKFEKGNFWEDAILECHLSHWNWWVVNNCCNIWSQRCSVEHGNSPMCPEIRAKCHPQRHVKAASAVRELYQRYTLTQMSSWGFIWERYTLWRIIYEYRMIFLSAYKCVYRVVFTRIPHLRMYCPTLLNLLIFEMCIANKAFMYKMIWFE